MRRLIAWAVGMLAAGLLTALLLVGAPLRVAVFLAAVTVVAGALWRVATVTRTAAFRDDFDPARGRPSSGSSAAKDHVGREPAGAVRGHLRVDPVCGMAVMEAEVAPVTVNGVEYRFCSEMCRRSFAERPGRYLRLADRGHTAALPRAAAEPQHPPRSA